MLTVKNIIEGDVKVSIFKEMITYREAKYKLYIINSYSQFKDIMLARTNYHGRTLHILITANT